MDFSQEAIRAHFHRKTAEEDAIRSKLQPLRDELDALVAGDTSLTVKKAQAREQALRAEIVKLQEKLLPITNERAMAARALGGKTGAAPK